MNTHSMYQSGQPGQPRRGGVMPSVSGVTPIRQNVTVSAGGIGISPSASRIPDMLEQIKGEFESVLQQLSIQKMERDEYERKLQSQLQEMEQIQQTLKALESNHRRIRQQYEEDVMRLRRQYEGGQGVPPKAAKRSRPTPEENDRMPTDRMPTDRMPPNDRMQQNERMPVGRGGSRSASPVRVSPAPARTHEGNGTVNRTNVNVPPPRRNMVSEVEMQNEKSDSREREREGALPLSLKKVKVNPAENPPDDRMSKPRSDRNGERPGPSGESLEQRGGGGTAGSNVGEEESNASTSTGGKPKVKWTIAYNSKANFGEMERPHVEMKHTLDHQSVVCCVRFSSDGTQMASGCHKTAQVFDVNSGQEVFSVSRPTPPSTPDGEDAYVRAVCFSPDGTKLVAGMPQNTIKIWDIATKQEGLNLRGHESEIYSLDYVNNFIASGSGDRVVRLWNASSGDCIAVLGNETTGPMDGVTSVALSPDGRFLAAASLDKMVRIWDTTTTQMVHRLDGHTDSVYSIAFSPDGKNVISGSLDRCLILWDLNARESNSRGTSVFTGHKDFVLSVAYTPDGRWLMSGSKDRSVIFWDPRTHQSMLTLSGYRNSVISVASSPSTPAFATGSGDCFACIWKYQNQS